jgi:hypothetical protein
MIRKEFIVWLCLTSKCKYLIHIYSYEHIFTAMKAYLLLWTYISCREYYFTVINICIEYQNKKYAFNWLNTLHVTFTSPRYRLSCWYRPVQKPCIDRCYPIDLDQWKWYCPNRRRGKYLFHGPYHDPREFCISWYCNFRNK